MKWRKNNSDAVATASLQRSHDEDLVVFARAILTNNPQAEAHLDSYLDPKEERQRWSFLKRLRQHIKKMRDEQPQRKGFFRFGRANSEHDQEEERAEEIRIALLFERQKQRIIAQRKRQVKRWLAHILPVFNARNQAIQRQVLEELRPEMEKLGHELEHEGIHSFESFKAANLGELHADATEDTHARHHGKGSHDHS